MGTDPFDANGDARRWPAYREAMLAAAARHGAGVADTFAAWQWQQACGVPPFSQLHNRINHPGAGGHALFADTILGFFPERAGGRRAGTARPPGSGRFDWLPAAVRCYGSSSAERTEMSKSVTRHVFTSESVSEGHPDKVCDQISDAVLDACLALDPQAHVACETLATANLTVNAGELKVQGVEQLNFERIAREVVREIGYVKPGLGYSFDTFNYLCALHSQSPDIDRGVSRPDPQEQGAGDQGMMFGYATRATPELMPAPIMLAHRLLEKLAALRKSGAIEYLEPDSKAQVSVLHDKGRPAAITSVVISHQTQDVPPARIAKDLKEVAVELLKPSGLLTNETAWFINPTGRFVIGGPQGDTGLTGRKIIVDTYGGVGAHGGGAFSGKDPSKVDRSAAYYARYAAKNIVAAGLADKCEIQVAYAIGVARPLSINVATFGTAALAEERIARILEQSGIFDFTPAGIVRELGLLRPQGWRYRDTAAYGHFGRAQFPWERTDRVEALRSAARLR
jgi:S-adenosylmethionine synthetase